MMIRNVFLSTVVVGVMGAGFASAGTDIPANGHDNGATVTGYQDFFTGSTLNPAYIEINNGMPGTPSSFGANSHFSLSGGPDATSVLHIGANNITADPNKLLYGGTYDQSNQTVEALITVTSNLPVNDADRGGIATASDAASGQGINGLFTDHFGDGAHVTTLNDTVAWGNEGGTAVTTSAKYWLLVQHGSDNSVETKIWAADGTTAEPSAFETQQSNFGNRTGLAGLVSDSFAKLGQANVGTAGNTTFDVGYLLIEASGANNSGVSSITVGSVPEPASLGLLGIGGLGLLARRRRV